MKEKAFSFYNFLSVLQWSLSFLKLQQAVIEQGRNTVTEPVEVRK